MPLIKTLKGIPKWYIGKGETYDKLKNEGTIDPKGIYFIYDRGQILNRDKKYMQGVYTYQDERPVIGASDRLYINANTYEGYLYHNGWVKVFDPLNKDFTYNETIILDKVSGIATRVITDKLIEEISTKSIQEIYWDTSTRSMIYKFKTVKHSESMKRGLLTKIEFDMEQRILKGYDEEGNLLGEQSIMDNHIISAYYDEESKQIVFHLKDGNNVLLHPSSMMDIFLGKNTSSMQTTLMKDSGKNNIKMDIIQSDVIRNILQIKEDALYVKGPDYFTIAGTKEGHVYTVLNEHVIIEDRYKLDDLATEEYLYDMMQYIENIYDNMITTTLTKDSIVNDSLSSIEDASTDKIPTYALLNKIAGIKRFSSNGGE